MNGKRADSTLTGAIIVLVLMVVCITYLVAQDKQIPDIFIVIATTLLGFIAGTRVVTNEVKDKVIEKEKEDTKP